MGYAKELLLKDKDLAGWLNALVNDDRFKRCVSTAKAELIDTKASREQLDGALSFLDIFSGLSQPISEPIEFPPPGLHHDLDNLKQYSPTSTTK